MKHIVSMLLILGYIHASYAHVDINEVDFVRAMSNCDRLKESLPSILLDESRRILFLQFQQAFERYVRSQKRPSGVVIPKIIHQIWVGPKKIPDRCLKYMEAWKTMFPDWTYILWTDETIGRLSLINSDLSINSMNMGEKSDILRYEILYQIGGLYVDVDFEPLDREFFEQLHRNCDFYAGLLPPELDIVVANGLIGCKPGHSLMLEIIQALPTSWHKSGRIVDRTGPEFMTGVLAHAQHWNDGVNLILPANIVYPFSWEQVLPDCSVWIRPETAAVHYYTGTWQ